MTKQIAPVDWGYELKGLRNGQEIDEDLFVELKEAAWDFKQCAIGEALFDKDEYQFDKWGKPCSGQPHSMAIAFTFAIRDGEWGTARRIRARIRKHYGLKP